MCTNTITITICCCCAHMSTTTMLTRCCTNSRLTVTFRPIIYCMTIHVTIHAPVTELASSDTKTVTNVSPLTGRAVQPVVCIAYIALLTNSTAATASSTTTTTTGIIICTALTRRCVHSVCTRCGISMLKTYLISVLRHMIIVMINAPHYVSIHSEALTTYVLIQLFH